jgi:PHD/YefM family antitoxin component YafN of YafNO toxin-antitoxin module
MTNTAIADTRSGLLDLIDNIVSSGEMVAIKNKDGDTILLREEDYSGILETLDIISHPEYAKSILDGMAVPLDECIDGSVVGW